MYLENPIDITLAFIWLAFFVMDLPKHLEFITNKVCVYIFTGFFMRYLGSQYSEIIYIIGTLLIFFACFILYETHKKHKNKDSNIS